MNTKIAITLGAVALSVVSGAAYAGSVTVPGETVGIAIGAPLPEGVYFVDTSGFGASRGGSKNWSDFSIPVIAWSTPWQFLGGRIETYVAAPVIAYGNTAYGDQTPASFNKAIYNPALFVGEAWNLGGGWNFSQFFGGYAPVDNALNQNFWTFNSRSAITYNADKWNLTAHVIYGAVGEQLGGPAEGLKTNPDYLNLDLTATKTFDKWEVGVVAFGSWDVSGTSDRFRQEQSQFAIGGLVGYNFTGISLQAYLTHDIWTENYFSPTDSCNPVTAYGCEKAYETRFWTRVVIPLWSPPAEELAPVTYKK